MPICEQSYYAHVLVYRFIYTYCLTQNPQSNSPLFQSILIKMNNTLLSTRLSLFPTCFYINFKNTIPNCRNLWQSLVYHTPRLGDAWTKSYNMCRCKPNVANKATSILYWCLKTGAPWLVQPLARTEEQDCV